MFSETSHHRNIPFLGKNIPYLEGGPGGERGKTKRLKFFYLPRAIFAIPGPLGNLPFYCCFLGSEQALAPVREPDTFAEGAWDKLTKTDRTFDFKLSLQF